MKENAQILPASVEVERLVLAVSLMDPERMHEVRPVLELDDFSTDPHRRVWRKAAELYDSGKTPDKVTVAMALRDSGDLDAVGGLSYVSALDNGMPQLPNLTEYVGTLKRHTMQRRLMGLGQNITQRAADREDPQTILDSIATLTLDIKPSVPGKGLVSAKQLVDRVGVSEILAPRRARGVDFPWSWMNHFTSGMLPGELWVLAAHTSAGKTSAAIQTAVHIASRQSKPAAVFSLEMGDVSVFQRAVWQRSRVDSESAKRGRLTTDERERVNEAVNTLYGLPLYFDDGSFSVMEIHARLRQLRARGAVGMVVVDYLQLLRDGGRHNSRAEAVGANARSLKLMAGEFECPVLLLSQFNRESAKGDKPRRPELYDLKESGDIENHANGVWLIHRTDPNDGEQVPVEFILAKQREGRRNVFQQFWFMPRYQRFEAIGDDHD